MKTNIKSIKPKILVIALFSAILMLPATLYGQAGRSLYFLPIVPQLHNANPAHIPDYKLHVGIPFLSSVRTGFENTFIYEDIFQRRGDSLYLEREYLVDNLKDDNEFNLNLMEEYFSLGAKFGENYVSFRIADMFSSTMGVSKDFIRFLLYGNGSEYYLGRTADFSGNTLDFSYYREYALGYARSVDDRINVGIHLKYLQGIANMNTEKMNFDLYTDPDDLSISVQSDILLNMSVPGVDDEDVSTGDFISNTQNSGFALDLGLHYQINKKLLASAGIINFGSISWNDNLKNYHTENPEKVFTYEGFDFDEIFEDDALNDDRLNEIFDSISDEIGIVEFTKKYRTNLPALLTVNLNYELTENDIFGVLVRNKFLPDRNWLTATVGYTRYFGRNINVMLSNSFFSDSYFNPGLGIAANLGPVQLYLVNENVAAPFALTKVKSFSLRFGVNLVFGKKKNEKLITEPVEDVPEMKE